MIAAGDEREFAPGNTAEPHLEIIELSVPGYDMCQEQERELQYPSSFYSSLLIWFPFTFSLP